LISRPTPAQPRSDRAADIRFLDLPDWVFIVRERSASMYDVIAKDCNGRSVLASGTNEKLLVQKCRQWARDIDTQLGRPATRP